MQKDFAKELGFSIAHISEIENGKSVPGYDVLISLAEKFNVNIYYVLFNEGDMFSDPLTSFFSRSSHNTLSTEQSKEFLHYFEKSPFVQVSLYAYLKKFVLENTDLINKELDAFKRKKKDL